MDDTSKVTGGREADRRVLSCLDRKTCGRCGMGKQACAVPGCPHRSLKSMQPGRGRCQYHYNMFQWGAVWADHCEALSMNEAAPGLEAPA
jgi:hypothetical protein